VNSANLAAYEAALDKEKEACLTLLDSLEEHQRALASHDPERIGAAVQVNLESLEGLRLATLARREHEGEAADDAARPLREKLMELGKLGREIRRRNERNRRMVEHSLDLLHGEFRTLDEMIQSAMGRSREERAGGSLVSARA